MVDMKQRILTGVLAAIVFLFLVIVGKLPFTILIYAMGSVALFELLRMKKLKLVSLPGLIGLLLLWMFLLPSQYSFFEAGGISKMEIALFAVLLLLTYTVLVKNTFTFDEVGFITLAAIYIGMCFHYFIEIRNLDQYGLTYIFYACVVIWSTDSGAYFVGKSLGKRKLWPEISPNKTVEGFAGGIVIALVLATIFQLVAQLPIPYIYLLLITLFLSVFGQLGDLVESALKRHYDVKDSGNILPGHGGILDRFDSFLFVMPFLYFLLALFS
ncbi:MULTISPECIES: phosphatidate cytidylyltransferase [Bacillus]|uniref:phosphatidate cytidylyltransferase n=1 Tax=Bacillus TaxID=1386 RepID=UPI0009B573C0|nr:phosphatidate cytidylyltransferase [Bacillus subtilis]MBJ3803925.1 phosphatidate cytidylyltransferase [Bacillus subtilis]MBR0021456.1 phosphatidate cytidylyltransferase [Bacillus subtilis]MEC2386604.1 phosphatidate cytidylyltransferase [Bacillus subtilis]MEC3694979.1 phosphatidate cytidylyltransferase [Bacillus subtilis]MED4520646.1 phosphatidate cytidylyltransferase [Bacillus subtilis]